MTYFNSFQIPGGPPFSLSRRPVYRQSSRCPVRPGPCPPRRPVPAPNFPDVVVGGAYLGKAHLPPPQVLQVSEDGGRSPVNAGGVATGVLDATRTGSTIHTI